jgi:hypothetical protein
MNRLTRYSGANRVIVISGIVLFLSISPWEESNLRIWHILSSTIGSCSTFSARMSCFEDAHWLYSSLVLIAFFRAILWSFLRFLSKSDASIYNITMRTNVISAHYKNYSKNPPTIGRGCGHGGRHNDESLQSKSSLISLCTYRAFFFNNQVCRQQIAFFYL